MSNSEKRSVSTDALETLGTIIGEGCGRDAIHLAVEPVEAGETLRPGQDVSLADGKAYRTAKAKKVGIVDPFLKAEVLPGERFWLVVYPRQITSLRHVWSHPDFAGEATHHQERPVTAGKLVSEIWMRKWAMEHVSDDYYGDSGRVSEAEAFAFAIQAGENNHIGPYERARDHIDDEWWSHWETITGKPGQRDEYFSCSC